MSTARLLSASLLAAVAMAHPHIIVETEGSLSPRAMSARPRLDNLPYGMSLTSCSRPGLMALTFDDGPGPFTSTVLDLLEKAGNLKATFFLNGKNGNGGITVPELQPVVKRMIASGHQVGSHSFSHANFDEITEDERVQELVKNEDAFAAVLGFVPTYFRPPFTACGAACQATATKLAYRITDYDLDTKDFEGDYVAAKKKFSDGVSQNPKSWVSLAHDIHERTSNELVPFMIEQAKAKGYQFVTMGDCLGDPKENWYRDPTTGGPVGNAKPPAASQASSSAPAATSARAISSRVSSTPVPSGAVRTSGTGSGARPSTTPAPRVSSTGGARTSTGGASFFNTTTRGPGGGAAVPILSTTRSAANATRPIATVSQPPQSTLPTKSGAGRAIVAVQAVAGAVLAFALLI